MGHGEKIGQFRKGLNSGLQAALSPFESGEHYFPGISEFAWSNANPGSSSFFWAPWWTANVADLWLQPLPRHS